MSTPGAAATDRPRVRVAAAVLAIAAAIAGGLAAVSSPEPFMARLVRLEAAAAAPEMAASLEHEPLAVNAVVLEYASDTQLLLNARLALDRYGSMSRRVLPVYGLQPEFRRVLKAYGPAVMPPIVYYMDHDSALLRMRRAAQDAVADATEMARRLVGAGAGEGASVDGVPEGAASASSSGGAQAPDAIDRGWYAVSFIDGEGHDFLGQFVVDGQGRVERVQTERLTEAATAFFSGGIRGLETRFRMDEEAGVGDYLWAGVDLALAAGAVKVLRVGRAAGVARAGAAPARTALVARTVVQAGRSALRVGRYAVPVGVAYALVRHPSLISGLAAHAAALAGLPVRVVQGVVWFLLLLPVLVAARNRVALAVAARSARASRRGRGRGPG